MAPTGLVPPQRNTPARWRRIGCSMRCTNAIQKLIVQTTSLDLAMAIRAVGADLSGDSTARHADFAAMVQLLPPGTGVAARARRT